MIQHQLEDYFAARKSSDHDYADHIYNQDSEKNGSDHNNVDHSSSQYTVAIKEFLRTKKLLT